MRNFFYSALFAFISFIHYKLKNSISIIIVIVNSFIVSKKVNTTTKNKLDLPSRKKLFRWAHSLLPSRIFAYYYFNTETISPISISWFIYLLEVRFSEKDVVMVIVLPIHKDESFFNRLAPLVYSTNSPKYDWRWIHWRSQVYFTLSLLLGLQIEISKYALPSLKLS